MRTDPFGCPIAWYCTLGKTDSRRGKLVKNESHRSKLR